MENQRHQPVHSISHRENESSPGQDYGGVPVAKYIHVEMISPNSLLRSDRFTKSQPTEDAVGQDHETARVFEQQLRRREDKANKSATGKRQGITSPMTEAANVMHRRTRATTTTSESGFHKLRKRGRAPAKVRLMMTPATTSTAQSLGRQHGGEQNDGTSFNGPSSATTSPHELSDPSFFSDMPAVNTSQLVDSETTEPCHRAQLSQSPLRPSLATFASAPLGHFQKSSMQSKPASLSTRVSPDRIANKVSEKQPSSQLDEWSSRCFNLTQQIVEHLRSWNELSSDGQIGTSPILSRPHSLKSASMDRLSQARELCSCIDGPLAAFVLCSLVLCG